MLCPYNHGISRRNRLPSCGRNSSDNVSAISCTPRGPSSIHSPFLQTCYFPFHALPTTAHGESNTNIRDPTLFHSRLFQRLETARAAVTNRRPAPHLFSSTLVIRGKNSLSFHFSNCLPVSIRNPRADYSHVGLCEKGPARPECNELRLGYHV